jgi:uncharacterized protein
MVAIGNGTASRESELFVAEQLKQVQQEAFYVIVNEAGASVYSASDIARNIDQHQQLLDRFLLILTADLAIDARC